MNVPDYAGIGGPPQTNGNRHYKIFVGPDSAGNPGIWHVYFDGAKEFLVSPVAAAPPAWNDGGNSIASGVAAALAPAPAPASSNPPVDSNGGVQAPADTAAAPIATVTPVSINPGTAMQTPPSGLPSWDNSSDSGIWITNNTPGNKHEGDKYRVDPGHDSQGHAGTWHTYQDGSKEFMISPMADTSSDPSVTVVSTTSSTGVNHADGLHTTSGFSGQARELHIDNSSTPVADTSSSPVATATAAPADASPAADPSHLHTVVTGDTMWDIAQAHNMTLEQLTAFNPQVEHPELILPGQQINLGNGEAVVPASVSTDPAAAFPTTSSYDTTTTQPQTAEAHKVSMGGWSDGTNTVPNDPTHGIASVAQVQTDPLKIDEHKQAA